MTGRPMVGQRPRTTDRRRRTTGSASGAASDPPDLPQGRAAVRPPPRMPPRSPLAPEARRRLDLEPVQPSPISPRLWRRPRRQRHLPASPPATTHGPHPRRHPGRHRRRRPDLRPPARRPPHLRGRRPRRLGAERRAAVPRGLHLDAGPSHARVGLWRDRRRVRARGDGRGPRLLGARRERRRRDRDRLRRCGRRRRLQRAQPPDGGRRAAADPGGQPGPPRARAPADVARGRDDRHQPELLDGRARDGAGAAARGLRRRGRPCRHAAGALGRGLPGRPLARHPRQRRPVHRRRGGQAGDGAAQDPGHARGLWRRAGGDDDLGAVHARAGHRRPHRVRLGPAERRPERGRGRAGAPRLDLASGGPRPPDGARGPARRRGRHGPAAAPPRESRRRDDGQRGQIQDCPVLGVKFVVLSHNTVRGAAGGALLNAELLVAEGLVRQRQAA